MDKIACQCMNVGLYNALYKAYISVHPLDFINRWCSGHRCVCTARIECWKSWNQVNHAWAQEMRREE